MYVDTADLVVRIREMLLTYWCTHVSYLQAATKEFESEVLADSCNPLVMCAMEMMSIMAEVEPLLQ